MSAPSFNLVPFDVLWQLATVKKLVDPKRVYSHEDLVAILNQDVANRRAKTVHQFKPFSILISYSTRHLYRQQATRKHPKPQGQESSSMTIGTSATFANRSTHPKRATNTRNSSRDATMTRRNQDQMNQFPPDLSNESPEEPEAKSSSANMSNSTLFSTW